MNIKHYTISSNIYAIKQRLFIKVTEQVCKWLLLLIMYKTCSSFKILSNAVVIDMCLHLVISDDH